MGDEVGVGPFAAHPEAAAETRQQIVAWLQHQQRRQQD
jgi:hypothetical protein